MVLALLTFLNRQLSNKEKNEDNISYGFGDMLRTKKSYVINQRAIIKKITKIELCFFALCTHLDF